MADVFANETNKANMFKTKEGDTQSGYAQEKLLGSTYLNVIEVDGSSGKALQFEVDATALADGVSSNKVQCSVTDTTADYLFPSLVAGTGVAITKSSGGDEKVTIAGAYTEGAGIDITAAVIKLDANLDDLKDAVIGAGAEGQLISYDSGSSKFVNTDYAVETTFSGTASKVPNAGSLKTLLQALNITNAVNCGSSGTPIMYKTKPLNVLAMPINEIAYTASSIYTTHLPKTIPDPNLVANSQLAFSGRNKAGVWIQSKESSPEGAGDGYAYLFGNTIVDEDWDALDGAGMTLSVIVSNTDGIPVATKEEVVFRAEYLIYDTEDVSVSSSNTQKVYWELSGDTNVKEVRFPLTLTNLTAGSPLSVSFQLSVGSQLHEHDDPDLGYAIKNEINIHSIRLLCATKTINLPIASV